MEKRLFLIFKHKVQCFRVLLFFPQLPLGPLASSEQTLLFFLQIPENVLVILEDVRVLRQNLLQIVVIQMEIFQFLGQVSFNRIFLSF